jgi:hypothetical protein
MGQEILAVTAHSLSNARWWRAARDDLSRTHYWSDDWSPEFYRQLARAGFISTSLEYADPPYLLLPELQQAYAVLDFDRLVTDRHVAKLLAGPVEQGELVLRLTPNFLPVAQAVLKTHQPCWLFPPYLQLLQNLSGEPSPEFSLMAAELRTSEGALVAGELGYRIGATYTSLTGFFDRSDRRWNNAGKLQLVLLAQALQRTGLEFWNLGHPYMPYKVALGAKILPRAEFLERWAPAVQNNGTGLASAYPWP